MKNNNEKRNDCSCIKGVTCEVKSCVYHDSESRCTADRISVGPAYATNSSDTACATFQPKEL